MFVCFEIVRFAEGIFTMSGTKPNRESLHEQHGPTTTHTHTHMEWEQAFTCK